DESVVRRQGRPARRFRFRAEAGHLLGGGVGALRGGAVGGVGPGEWSAAPYELDDAQQLFLFSRADTIYGGSDEVQRTIIAERVLGLPREPKGVV
ncbi:acyl-CoA dehydrogenase family protein, partial [Streptomyces muensis]